MAFVHVPKVAGTSIELLFKNHGWNMTLHARHYDPYVPSPQHMTYTDLGQAVPDLDSLTSFMVIRSPMARIRSEWQYHFGVLFHTLLDFPDFVRHMESSLEVSKTYWDNHWRPQSDFASDKMDRIFQIENISQELPVFLEEHDIIKNAELPHNNRSQRNKKKVYQRHYRVDQVTADRINRIYGCDYDRFHEFGYTPDEIKLT